MWMLMHTFLFLLSLKNAKQHLNTDVNILAPPLLSERKVETCHFTHIYSYISVFLPIKIRTVKFLHTRRCFLQKTMRFCLKTQNSILRILSPKLISSDKTAKSMHLNKIAMHPNEMYNNEYLGQS